MTRTCITRGLAVVAAILFATHPAHAGVGLTELAGQQGDGPVTVFYPAQEADQPVQGGVGVGHRQGQLEAVVGGDGGVGARLGDQQEGEDDGEQVHHARDVELGAIDAAAHAAQHLRALPGPARRWGTARAPCRPAPGRRGPRGWRPSRG